MKLIIQIPCFNEEQTLPITLKSLPQKVAGVDEVEVLIIDDGSTDKTVDVARAHGVHHIVRLAKNKGLAEGFITGIDAALKIGADIIVNTDGDNQYCGDDIERLIQPIVKGKAEFVIGDRKVNGVAHFSFVKKKLQVLGSWVVRQLSGTQIPDVTSGFRAMSREAALRMNVVSRYTYTLETIIQAGKKNIALDHVPVRTNMKLRESRLFSNIGAYIKKSMSTMIRIYTMYEPLKMFLYIGSLFFGGGLLIGVRFLYYYFFIDRGEGHIQSLILAAVLLILGFQVFMIGLLADVIGANRSLIEDALYRIKKMELKPGKDSSDKEP